MKRKRRTLQTTLESLVVFALAISVFIATTYVPIERWMVAMVIFCLGSITFAIFYNRLKDKGEEKAELNSGVVEKLADLDKISATLRELIDFIAEQKGTIRREQEAIQSLSKEKADLEPVVAHGRKVVGKMFELQEERNRRHRIVNLAIGFFLGILSSVIAGYVVGK